MGIAYNTSVVRDGLVLYLDAANPKSYPGSGTTWFDLSASKKNGTLINGSSFNNINKGIISFDGVDDYFKISSFTSISTQFTISSFIYPVITSGIVNDRDTYGGTIFSQDSVISGDRYPLWFRIRGTELSYSIWSNNPVGITTSGANILLNNWYYITIVSEKNGILKIYINDNLFINSTSGNTGNWNGDFYLGDLRDGRNIRFGGEIANVLLYDRLLQDDEIKQNFEGLRGRYGI